MKKGHNNPPVYSKQPGTNLPWRDVPPARIYHEPRSVMQAGNRKRPWILEFEKTRPLGIDPYTRWTTNADPYRHIHLRFPDCSSAVEFAERQGWDYRIHPEPASHVGRTKVQNLYRGVEADGAFPIRWPGEGKENSNHRLHRGVDTISQTARDEECDPVTEALIESFPASDPPAFTGTTLA